MGRISQLCRYNNTQNNDRPLQAPPPLIHPRVKTTAGAKYCVRYTSGEGVKIPLRKTSKLVRRYHAVKVLLWNLPSRSNPPQFGVPSNPQGNDRGKILLDFVSPRFAKVSGIRKQWVWFTRYHLVGWMLYPWDLANYGVRIQQWHASPRKERHASLAGVFDPLVTQADRVWVVPRPISERGGGHIDGRGTKKIYSGQNKST